MLGRPALWCKQETSQLTVEVHSLLQGHVEVSPSRYPTGRSQYNVVLLYFVKNSLSYAEMTYSYDYCHSSVFCKCGCLTGAALRPAVARRSASRNRSGGQHGLNSSAEWHCAACAVST